MVSKELETLQQQIHEREICVKKDEKKVHGIADGNSCLYKQIKQIEDCIIPGTVTDITM